MASSKGVSAQAEERLDEIGFARVEKKRIIGNSVIQEGGVVNDTPRVGECDNVERKPISPLLIQSPWFGAMFTTPTTCFDTVIRLS